MTATAVLLSADVTLARDLQSRVAGDLTLVQFESTEAVLHDLQQGERLCLIVDFRCVLDGGHSAARFLDDLERRFPRLDVIMLCGEHCPEPLERRAACSDMECVRAALDAAPPAQALETRLARRQAAETIARPVPAPPPPSEDSEIVLEGATRNFATNSPQLKRMLQDLAIAAAHDVTILLIGETGSGKTYLSNLIHEASPRRAEPFIHVACGALPRELIEGELFGHVKGAFTSAHADKEGKFVAAGKGTLLLDEIDVLGPEQQVKLLRVIETGAFEAVGSNRTMQSQARLVVASNLNLQPLVEQGRFRPDLYYRLNMLKFDIPPLRKRKMDILPLAKQFVAKFAEKHKVAVDRIDAAVLDELLGYPWPGNVRELEHVVQRAVIYCRDGVLTREQLPSHILTGTAGPTNDPSVVLPSRGNLLDATLGQKVALSEKDIIEQSLFKNNFSRTNTAKDLGISRVTLYNKMKKYEMIK